MSAGAIDIFSDDVDYTYPQPDRLSAWIVQALIRESKLYEYINIIFCSDATLLKLNQDYLNHDYFTDIITFQYNADPIEGELFISLDRVKDNATELKIPWIKELHRVIIHGVLHLMGYNDKNSQDASIIRQKENDYLERLHFG